MLGHFWGMLGGRWGLGPHKPPSLLGGLRLIKGGGGVLGHWWACWGYFGGQPPRIPQRMGAFGEFGRGFGGS